MAAGRVGRQSQPLEHWSREGLQEPVGTEHALRGLCQTGRGIPEVVEAGLAGAAAQGGAHRDRPPDRGQLARKHDRVRPALLAQYGRLESSHVAQQLQHAPPGTQSQYSASCTASAGVRW